MEKYNNFANSSILYTLGIVVVLFIMAESVTFLWRAYREGVRMGMQKSTLNKTISASAMFTLLPSISILLGVIALSGSLGIPLPWMRLTVVGALHYELMAADIAATGAGLSKLPSLAEMTPVVFVTVATVMTLGILWGVLLVIFGLKTYQKKVTGFSNKSNNWGEILFSAMFIGLVCAYIGRGASEIRASETTSGNWTAVVVILSSFFCMGFFNMIIKKFNQKWLESFSLAFSMFLGMTSAVVFNYYFYGV